jgi:hypothetical protein
MFGLWILQTVQDLADAMVWMTSDKTVEEP